MTRHTFSALDYCLFAATLAISAAIGVYFAFKGKKSQSPNEVLMGGRNMPVLPTALSLLTSFLSGITLLAIPAEVYSRGMLFWVSRVVGSLMALAMTYFVALPVFYGFRPTSINQYFEERFNSILLRRIGACLYLFFTVVYMAVVLYAPSVALHAITGIPTWIFVISVGVVCCVYTSFGGLKAVVWADTFQAVIMLVGVTLLMFLGASYSGGVSTSFNVAAAYGRVSVMGNLDPDPFQYMNLWGAVFGGIGYWFTLLTFNQTAVQRYLSMSTLKKARQVVLVNVPTYLILITLTDLIGMVMFAFYKHCDPISSGMISSKDQLVIVYALEVFKTLPGLPGVFLACLFSGTLSTVSSGINSMAAVTWEDFLLYALPLYTDGCGENFTAPVFNYTNNSYSQLTGFKRLFSIMDIVYSAIGLSLVIIVGAIASLCFKEPMTAERKHSLRLTYTEIQKARRPQTQREKENSEALL